MSIQQPLKLDVNKEDYRNKVLEILKEFDLLNYNNYLTWIPGKENSVWIEEIGKNEFQLAIGQSNRSTQYIYDDEGDLPFDKVEQKIWDYVTQLYNKIKGESNL
jgi:hypothetical protein